MDKNLKEFRCQKCNGLQFKYNISRDSIIVQTKCYSCNQFNNLEINLNPLFEIWNLEKNKKKLKKDENHK
jgi:phage FluMu protein Com